LDLACDFCHVEVEGQLISAVNDGRVNHRPSEAVDVDPVKAEFYRTVDVAR
jgi:hypothetical protein